MEGFVLRLHTILYILASYNNQCVFTLYTQNGNQGNTCKLPLLQAIWRKGKYHCNGTKQVEVCLLNEVGTMKLVSFDIKVLEVIEFKINYCSLTESWFSWAILHTRCLFFSVNLSRIYSGLSVSCRKWGVNRHWNWSWHFWSSNLKLKVEQSISCMEIWRTMRTICCLWNEISATYKWLDLQKDTFWIGHKGKACVPSAFLICFFGLYGTCENHLRLVQQSLLSKPSFSFVKQRFIMVPHHR